MRDVLLPADIDRGHPVGLRAYQSAVRRTNQLPPGDIETPILGLFGEVGSLLTVVKKLRRDATTYPEYTSAILEELGDVLWYFTALVDRVGLDVSIVAQGVVGDLGDTEECRTWADIQGAGEPGAPTEMLRQFGVVAGLVGEMVAALQAGKLRADRSQLSGELVAVLDALVTAATAAGVDLDLAARGNLEKVFSRYPLEPRYPAPFDAQAPVCERLPRRFGIRIEEHRSNGRAWVTQTMNDALLGDPITDNKAEADDYRFHDVFHIAYAVHLGWSPILRRLLKVKRKSSPLVDENEDGARAAIIEEGISTFIFGRALERDLFNGLERLDFDLLKGAHRFVRGFEAERCHYWQWERAILDGFRVFRDLKRSRSGLVRADLDAHTLEYVGP